MADAARRKARKVCFVKATRALPPGYRQRATLDLTQSKTAMAGAVALGMVLLFAVAWFLVQFIRLLRPAALEGLAFRNMLTVTPDGALSFGLPIIEIAVALVVMLPVHELVHGLFFWWFAGQRPQFGVKGLFLYAAAPPDVYFPRNQFLIVGLAPLVLLTLVGLLLILIVPVGAVSILSLFVIFTVAGAAGDIVMALQFLPYSADSLIQDQDTGAIVYGPEQT